MAQKVVIPLPATCKWQPNDERNKDASGVTFTDTAKGALADLATFAADISAENAEYLAGKTASTYRLTRTNGGLGLLQISGVPTPSQDEEGDDKPIEDIWGLKTSRIDLPIEVYCGESVSNPSKTELNMWRQEGDPDIAAADSFKTGDGVIHECTAATQALLLKVKRGTESVMRFYPTINRKRVWAKTPKSLSGGLGKKGTPSAPAPISSILNSYQWLKTQDDLEQQSDGTWAETESWIGAQTWDDDLYGAAPWDMPASP